MNHQVNHRGGYKKLEAFFKAGVFLALVITCTWAIVWLAERDGRPPRAQSVTCVNNLKQITLAFKQWALDHEDQFPFNVSTNAGGTMELCSVGKDGFDNNAVVHFLAVSNELYTPLVLHCPQDRKRKAVRTFAEFSRDNLTYRMRTGTNLSDASPREVLIVCPIDGNTAYCDGTVVEGKK